MPGSIQTVSFTPQPSLRRLFRRVMIWSAGIACVIHLIVLIVLCAVGVYGLAWISAASLIFYALALLCLIADYQSGLWLYLLLLEVLGYSVVASFWVGLGSGFYYYIFIVAPCLVLADIRPPLLKWCLVNLAVTIMLATVCWVALSGPAVELSSSLLLGLTLFNLACAVAIMTFVAQLYYQLVTRAHRRLGLMAATDPLTGLLNRRSLIETWTHTRQFAGHEFDGFGIALCDIDHFKTVNDQFGHETGDTVLRTIAERLREGVRSSDYVARWGGEEFLLLLPNADLEATTRIAEALRYAIGDQPIAVGCISVSVTLTFGVAYDDGENSLDQAVSRADAALYRGKHGGRNRVRP